MEFSLLRKAKRSLRESERKSLFPAEARYLHLKRTSEDCRIVQTELGTRRCVQIVSQHLSRFRSCRLSRESASWLLSTMKRRELLHLGLANSNRPRLHALQTLSQRRVQESPRTQGQSS